MPVPREIIGERSQPVNLDVNASWGLDPAVAVRLEQLKRHGLNPSSIHTQGQRARFMVEEARERLRSCLGLDNDWGVIFTSGATEANNTVVMSPFWDRLGKRFESCAEAQVVVSALEHPSVLEPVARLERLGFKTTRVAPDPSGVVHAQAMAQAVTVQTKLVSLMTANNETGVVMPVREAAELIRASVPSAVIHTDAVQALGKLPFKLPELGVDVATFSGHKIGALTGVGAIVYRRSRPVEALLLGGAQERHARAGTENVLGIASFGIAAELLAQSLDNRIEKMQKACAVIGKVLAHARPQAAQIGHAQRAPTGIEGRTLANTEIGHAPSAPAGMVLPNTLSITFPGIKADDLVVALDLKGICISSGAACASGKPDPSHVLLAMGYTPEQARSTVRISVGADLDEAAAERIGRTIVDTALVMEAK